MKKLVGEYGVKYLVHFTQLDNLESIFKYGILPVCELKRKRIRCNINDPNRYDYCEEASSVSIEFPNYKYFYSLRKEDEDIRWGVVLLYPNILWEKYCVFCCDNAANSTVSGLSIEERTGKDAFRKLYDEIPGKPKRSVLGIPKSWPTNPQAEILVFGTIEPEYIGDVIFKNQQDLNLYRKLNNNPNIDFSVNKEFFYGRMDHRYW